MKTPAARKHLALFAILGIAVLVAGASIVATHKVQKTTMVPSSGTQKTDTAKTSGTSQAISSPPSASTASDTQPSTSSSPPPQSPNGSFVSSYQVGINGQEQSACNTTAGASCSITFTMGSISKSLPATQVTSSAKNPQGAYATWSWEPSGIGLTAGSWSVSATATLNDQSATTKSNIQLEVTP
jgi:hypothetical protein